MKTCPQCEKSAARLNARLDAIEKHLREIDQVVVAMIGRINGHDARIAQFMQEWATRELMPANDVIRLLARNKEVIKKLDSRKWVQ